MSVRSASSSIERTRPIRLTCRYQLFSSSTVNAASGSRRMKRRDRGGVGAREELVDLGWHRDLWHWRSLSSLLPKTFQPCVRLPERHCTLVRIDVRATFGEQLVADRSAELVLGQPLSDSVDPAVESLAELGQMPRDVVGDAEVDERQPCR